MTSCLVSPVSSVELFPPKSWGNNNTIHLLCELFGITGNNRNNWITVPKNLLFQPENNWHENEPFCPMIKILLFQRPKITGIAPNIANRLRGKRDA